MRPEHNRAEQNRPEHKQTNPRHDNARPDQQPQQQKRDERPNAASNLAIATNVAPEGQKQALPQVGEKLSNRQERQKQFETRRDQQRAEARERHERRAAAVAAAAENGEILSSDAELPPATVLESGPASAAPNLTSQATELTANGEAVEVSAFVPPKQQTLFPVDNQSASSGNADQAGVSSDAKTEDDANEAETADSGVVEIGADGLPLERKRKRRRRGGRGRRRGREDASTDTDADDDSDDEEPIETTLANAGEPAASNHEVDAPEEKSRNLGATKSDASSNSKNESAWDRQVRDEQERDQRNEHDEAQPVSDAQPRVEAPEPAKVQAPTKPEPEARRERRPRPRPQPIMQPLPQPQSLALAVAVAVDQLSAMPASLAATSGQKRVAAPAAQTPEPAANETVTPSVRRPWMAEFPVNAAPPVEKPELPTISTISTVQASTPEVENTVAEPVTAISSAVSTATGAEP